MIEKGKRKNYKQNSKSKFKSFYFKTKEMIKTLDITKGETDGLYNYLSSAIYFLFLKDSPG